LSSQIRSLIAERIVKLGTFNGCGDVGGKGHEEVVIFLAEGIFLGALGINNPNHFIFNDYWDDYFCPD
jgi:hypothetical protein